MARSEPQVAAPRFLILAAVCVIVAALYFAQPVLMPLVLAVVVSFLLTPLCTRLERWGFPRPAAVALVVGVIFAAIFALGFVVYLQVVDLAGQLPSYQDDIVAKVRAIRGQSEGNLSKAAETIAKAAEAATSSPTTEPVRVMTGNVRPGEAPTNPIYTQPVEHANTFSVLSSELGMVLGPLGTFGIVLVFVIFMLIQREDLRDRMIRLVGHGQLQLTTQAMDDAASRISRYLVAQAIVNGTYGIAIAIGLAIIGYTMGDGVFPSFVLWGLLCAVLRFIPYVGPWVAAAFPVVLSFAVYPGYSVFFAVTGMFVVIELLSNNVMEPYLYGSSTGMSTVAVLVAAVFWAWLWGPIGLLLATPLTACIVVIGKYVPHFAFLDILLGDTPVLEPPQRLYQRLLAMDSEEAADIAEEQWNATSLEETYDNMILPALAMAEIDRSNGRLEDQRWVFIRGAVRELIEELADQERVRIIRVAADETSRLAAEGTAPIKPVQRPRLPEQCSINIVCLPAHDEADEIVAVMLARLLELRGYCATALSQNALASEMLAEMEKREAQIACVSALPPSAVAHARYLCKRIRAKFNDVPTVIGLWRFKADVNKARMRIGCDEKLPIVTSLMDALNRINDASQPLVLQATKQPVEESPQPLAAGSK
jgi:predicted PurR-regulated permease PerM